MSNLSDTYKKFLLGLLKTKCLYIGDKETDECVLNRQEKLLKFCDTIVNPTKDLELKYINYINDMIQIIKDKKDIQMVDKSYFPLFWKIIDKKSNKSGNFFFLTDNKDKNTIHIAMIIKNASNEDITNLQNYILLMYIQVCNSLYDNIIEADIKTQNIYNEIIELFENPTVLNDTSDIQDELKSIITSVMPSEEYGSSINDIMNDSQFSKIFDGVINTVCPADKLNELRSELKKTNRDELVEQVKGIKEKISSINIQELMTNVAQSGIFEQVAQSMGSMNNQSSENLDPTNLMNMMNNIDMTNIMNMMGNVSSDGNSIPDLQSILKNFNPSN
jgi:hypothetical protein